MEVGGDHIEGIECATLPAEPARLGGVKGSGNIGERLVDHRLGRFHGSGYACHQKTPIWKSIGRSTNRTKLLPRRRKKEEKKTKKIGGNEIPRESRGLTLKEERIEGKGKGQKKRYYYRKGRGSEIFQTPFLRRQDPDWQQPLSKWTRSRGCSHHRPVACLSFPFFLSPPHPHFPSPPPQYLSPLTLAPLFYIPLLSTVRLSPAPLIFFGVYFLLSLKFC